MTYKETLNKIVRELKDISDHTNKAVRPKIQELARHLELGITEKNPEILSKCRAALISHRERPDIIEVKHVSVLIKKMREEYFPNISGRTIELALDSKYKLVEKQSTLTGTTSRKIDVSEITDTQLMENKDELKERIRRIESGPAKDIKVKVSKKSIEEYDWKSPLAYELAKLAIKMENEYATQDHAVIKKVAKHVRTARDGRFATPLQNYEAMIVACNSTKSLDEVVEGEWEFKTRWEIYDDENHCKDCKDRLVDCYTKRCNHICHKVVKPMTTKGLKYAIKTDEFLKNLQDKMAFIMSDSWKDACEFGKILLKNPEQNKRLNTFDKKIILSAHIRKDKCDQCEQYLKDLNKAKQDNNA